MHKDLCILYAGFFVACINFCAGVRAYVGLYRCIKYVHIHVCTCDLVCICIFVCAAGANKCEGFCV